MALYMGNDHWAFLEHIEAPMWVDLTLEPNSNNQNVDDEWFQTSHQIHQSSSTLLKSVSGEEDMIIDSSLEEPSSPKSTGSVSRSRGNEYKSKKWSKNGCKSFSNKQDLVKVGTQIPSKPSFSDTRAVHESSGSNKNVTSEVPRLEMNKDTRFLEFLKNSFRKSYATRNPSRIGVNNDGRGSKSDKSSAGSSSDLGSSRMVKDTNLDSKCVVKNMDRKIKSKAGVANMSKTSASQVDKSRKVDKMKHQEAAKSKVRPNGRDSCAATKGATKVKVGGVSGKENAREKMVLNRSTSDGRHFGAQGMLWVQKETLHKEDKPGSLLRLKGSFGDRNEKKGMKAKPHFR